MKFQAVSALLTLTFAGLSSAIPAVAKSSYGLQTVHQFDDGTWIENMAVRKNGQIVANDISGGRIFLVDPNAPPSNPKLLHDFGRGTCVSGISEMEDDVFYTQSTQGDINTFQFTPNSSVIWKVDMRAYAKTGNALVTKVGDLKQAILPNGMTTLSKKDGIILISDSILGVVFSYNVNTRHPEVVFDDPILKIVQTDGTAFGVNGIRVVGPNTLYFDNLSQSLVAKVALKPNGHPAGPIHNITHKTPAADDFALDRFGNIWLAENTANTLVRVSPNGNVKTIAGGGNSTELVGPVSAVFGRTPRDKDILYIGTDGLYFPPGAKAPVSSNGKIAKIDTSKC